LRIKKEEKVTEKRVEKENAKREGYEKLATIF